MAAGAENAALGSGFVVACYLAVSVCMCVSVHVWEYASQCASVYSCIPGGIRDRPVLSLPDHGPSLVSSLVNKLGLC